MKVRILRDASYANFATMPKMSAQDLKVGDVVEFPDYYAKGIVASGMAELPVSYNPDVTMGAQKLADEHDIDLASVEGTGQDGRIIKADVQGMIEGQGQQ